MDADRERWEQEREYREARGKAKGKVIFYGPAKENSFYHHKIFDGFLSGCEDIDFIHTGGGREEISIAHLRNVTLMYTRFDPFSQYNGSGVGLAEVRLFGEDISKVEKIIHKIADRYGKKQVQLSDLREKGCVDKYL